MEADDRQVTTVFTVQPSVHYRHSTNPISWSVTIVGERAVTPHLVVRRRWQRFVILGLSSADGGMTVGLWKLSSLDGRRPPWYQPQFCRSRFGRLRGGGRHSESGSLHALFPVQFVLAWGKRQFARVFYACALEKDTLRVGSSYYLLATERRERSGEGQKTERLGKKFFQWGIYIYVNTRWEGEGRKGEREREERGGGGGGGGRWGMGGRSRDRHMLYGLH